MWRALRHGWFGWGPPPRTVSEWVTQKRGTDWGFWHAEPAFLRRQMMVPSAQPRFCLFLVVAFSCRRAAAKEKKRSPRQREISHAARSPPSVRPGTRTGRTDAISVDVRLSFGVESDVGFLRMGIDGRSCPRDFACKVGLGRWRREGGKQKRNDQSKLWDFLFDLSMQLCFWLRGWWHVNVTAVSGEREGVKWKLA